MNNWQKKVAEYTRKLQTQTQLPLWSIASEYVIHAAAMHEQLPWGKTTKKLRQLFLLSKKVRLSDVLLFSIGCIKAILIWINVKSKSRPTAYRFKKTFAGFGAASEEHLYKELKQQLQEPLLYINWINYTGMEQLGCPSLFSIISELYKNAFGHTAKFKKTPPEIRNYEVDFLTAAARTIGHYSFFCAYWKNAKLLGLEQVTFLVPDVPAFSCL